MTVEFFVQQFKGSNDKKAIFEKHIKSKQYTKYEDKIFDCKKIVKSTCWREIGNEQEFWSDSPSRFYFFSLTFLSRYTDIEFDQTPENILRDYNLFAGCGAFDYFMEIVFNDKWLSREYNEYQVLLNMCVDDEVKNNQSLIKFFKGIGNSIQNIFNEVINDPRVAESLGKNNLK